MRLPLVLSCLAIFTLSACATVKSTPRQDLKFGQGMRLTSLPDGWDLKQTAQNSDGTPVLILSAQNGGAMSIGELSGDPDAVMIAIVNSLTVRLGMTVTDIQESPGGTGFIFIFSGALKTSPDGDPLSVSGRIFFRLTPGRTERLVIVMGTWPATDNERMTNDFNQVLTNIAAD